MKVLTHGARAPPPVLRGLEREVLGLDAVRVRRPARALGVVDDDAPQHLVVERELVRREVDAHGVGAGLEDGAGHVSPDRADAR